MTTNFSGKISVETRSIVDQIKVELDKQGLPNANGDVLEAVIPAYLDSLNKEVPEAPATTFTEHTVEDDLDGGITFDDVEEIPVSYGLVVDQYNDLIAGIQEAVGKTLKPVEALEKSTLGGLFVVKTGDTVHSINAASSFKDDLLFFTKALAKGRVNNKLTDEEIEARYNARSAVYKEFRDIANLEDISVEVVSLNPTNTLKGIQEYIGFIKNGAKSSVQWPL